MSLIVAVADYAASFVIRSDPALDAARGVLIDVLAGGLEALREPQCAALVGPLVPGALMPGGARVPGTSLELDPAQAAFCLGVMLGRSPGSEQRLELPYGCAAGSLGALLATADYLARKATMEGRAPPTVRDLLAATVKALEIQGVLAPARDEPRTWTAALHLARVAATAVSAALLGGGRAQILDALSYASLDGAMSIDTDQPCEAAGRDRATAEAISRAVRHACQAVACSRSPHPTAPDPKAVDLAGRFLPASPSTDGQPFGTRIMARLADRRRPEDASRLARRFQCAVESYFPARQAERIKALFAEPERLDELPVNEWVAALVTNGAR